MAHIALRYAHVHRGGEQLRAEIRIGPDEAHLRSAGSLVLHAVELNALDRVLRVGAAMERPAHTYRITQED